MFKRILCGVIMIISVNSFAQTKVDIVTDELEKLSSGTFDNWKYSTDFSLKVSELSDPAFDDKGWKNITIGESIYPDSCWLRKEIHLPEYFAGLPLTGKLNFHVSVDDYGYLFVNGQELGHFPWDGEFLIENDARPGTKYVILIKAHNTGGPLRLLRAKIHLTDAKSTQQKVEDLILSLRTAQKLLSFETYQTNARVQIDPGIDKSTMDKNRKIELNELLQKLAAEIDVESYRRVDMDTYMKSVDKVVQKWQPIKEFVKQFTLQFTANAHIDAAWLWRKSETVEVCHKTFDSVLRMFRERPSFTYAQSQAVFYKWMKEYYPDLYKIIQSRIDEGRWEIVGGMWVEPDCNLPAGESWARQLLYGQRYFQNNLGTMAKIGWNPDSFGYNWNLPQFLVNAGIDAFITQKISWNDTNVFPYRVFWWQSPDGTKILTYFPFNYVDSIVRPLRFIDQLRQYESNTGFTKLLVLFGVGDHGGGPSLQMMKRIDHLREVELYPNVEFGTAGKYIDWLREHDLSELPVWNDELYLEYHRGTLTTQSNTKAWNRNSEVLLTDAEKFLSMANPQNKSGLQNELRDAWETVLFNQFHDILPGSSIREVYYDSDRDYKEADKIGNYVLDHSLTAIKEKIDTQKGAEGTPLVVFNSLSWTRNDLVCADLPDELASGCSITNADGNIITSQIIKKDRYTNQILFYAENVPALGYRTYYLTSNVTKPGYSYLSISDNKIENKFYKVTVDTANGWISSIFDKRYKREILTGPANRLQLLEDLPSAWDAWNIGLTGVEFPTNFRKIEISETGPVRTVLKIYRDYLKPGVTKDYPTEMFPSSFAVQEIILYNDIERIDLCSEVDWWEEKTMLKVAFPLSVTDDEATFEIPYGTIRRSTTLEKPLDKGKWEVAALRWADLSEDDYGISLLNKTKYGYDIKDNVMRLSLLRSPKWPDPTADRGIHRMEYALYPHKNRPEKSEVVRAGYEYNYPLRAVVTDRHDGDFPLQHSFINLSSENLVLSSVKLAEDSQALVLTIYETQGRDAKGVLRFAQKPEKAVFSDFLEQDGVPIPINGKEIHLTVKANSVVTVKVYF